MASRFNDTITLTIACAMVDKYLDDKNGYISLIEEVKDLATDFACKITDSNVMVYINTADDYDSGIFYNTVTGLSMENGDDGSVGRGNRVNGLITPFRPMSMEAAAGKNPVTHVGKLYNVLSKIISSQIAEEAGGDVEEVRVRILSQIGKPINQPQTASIQLIMEDGADCARWSREAESIADYWLDNIEKVTKKIVNGEITVF
jgi:S-adenosylmethionine synthetase